MKSKVLNVIFLLLLFTCDPVDNVDTLKSVADLCLNSNEVLSWNIAGDTCQAYAKEDLYGPINGAADLYINNGLIEYSLYNMADTSNSTVEIFVCNMGTTKNSATIFNLAKNDLTDSLSLKNYEGSTAIIGVFAIGTVYELHAKLECFYFKLTFLKIDNNNEAIEVSEAFLDLFQTKLR